MTHEELFRIIYGRAYLAFEPTSEQAREARIALARLSNVELRVWETYKGARLDQIRAERRQAERVRGR